mmetsp:Transcript_11422/g.26102  ORF Transcript_11422/g.26102 Transcript_11422/m.26102 type:complete len:108 (+) Transcript_11422:351-674(+)
MQSLVYLTADSDEEIESIDDDTIYVVGGLVDRNRHKGATLRTALESEVKTKKIAVRKYVDLAHGSSEVLTLNQVFGIILRLREGQSMMDACYHSIPNRKKKTNEEKL